MKQHISVEQLKELNGEQLNKLNNLVEPGAIGRITDALYEDLAKQVTVGRTIEMLKEKDICITIRHLINPVEDGFSWGWDVELRQTYMCFNAIELCDALWEALKAVL